ncbi:MAG: heavy-metal-associated domain-containing protein [Actinomycetota bacterium]|nr:heavy-metal-associated domain-containing protein [Actinomycetota bacterium]
MSTTTYRVLGKTCAHCVRAVETEVGAVEGVSDVRVDLETKIVTVDGDAVEEAAVRAAIEEAGYEAE